MNKVPTILIMDLETGGFDPRVNAVTEFAGIGINGETFEEIARFEAIIAPYSDELLYEPDALRITNISMEQIKAGMNFKTFTKEFCSFLKKINIHTHQKYRTILAGHNIVFDISFLQQLFFYMGKNLADYVACSTDYYGNSQPKYFDTLPLSMIRWGKDESMIKHSLSDCISKIGNEIVNAHRAMNDVIGNKDLLIEFLQSMRNENQHKTGDQIIVEQRFRETFKF